MLWGAFSEAILIIANVGTATAMYTVIKRRYPNLAISFVAARIMESVFIGVGILCVLTVVTLRQDYAGSDSPGRPGRGRRRVPGHAAVDLQPRTRVRRRRRQRLILGFIMYRTGLVPRRLAMFGLVGGPLIIATGSAAILGLIEPDGAIQILSAAPEFIWELGLGIYLIVKGFKTPNTNTPDQTAGPVQS